MRGRCESRSTPKTGRKSIVATEIPYQVNKAKLIEKIAELVRDKRIDGIADIRDESIATACASSSTSRRTRSPRSSRTTSGR
jgi:DNA gyrase subunit A